MDGKMCNVKWLDGSWQNDNCFDTDWWCSFW